MSKKDTRCCIFCWKATTRYMVYQDHEKRVRHNVPICEAHMAEMRRGKKNLEDVALRLAELEEMRMVP